MRRNMVLAFVEEMGHEYEALLEGAMDPATNIRLTNSTIFKQFSTRKINVHNNDSNVETHLLCKYFIQGLRGHARVKIFEHGFVSELKFEVLQ